MAKISSESIKKLAAWLDEIVVLKGLMEQFDGFAFRTALNFINNRWGDKIPDKLNSDIDDIINDVTTADYTAAEEKFGNFMAGLINTPLIDGTDDEVEAYQTIISGIDGFIRSYFDKKKKSA